MVVDELAPQATVVEVGVGGRFSTLAALGEARPDVRRIAVDVDEAALSPAPEGVQTHVDDVHDPRVSLYRDAELVFARRPPAELQPAIARLARALDASLALRALANEWADLTDIVGEPTVPESSSPWRWWPGDELDGGSSRDHG